MTKKILIAICMAVFGISVCFAQSNDSQTITNFEGVQLSIALTNDIIFIGSQTCISAKIKNSSTNIIQLAEMAPEQAFVVTLMSSSGKIHHLTHNAVVITRPLSSKLIDLKPGESRDWTIPVAIDNDVEPGKYLLKATRYFSVSVNSFKLVSNPLNVEIK